MSTIAERADEGSTGRKIRYAVVGLGHIAQVAVLPAFAHAKENSELAALVSGDVEKLKTLGKKYRIKATYGYDQYDECLRSGNIDAVYIALPNHLHCEYSVRAAEAGIHVLCEKPMAVTEDECQKMIHAAESARVRLMIAYRLHFEEANLSAIEAVSSGQIGEPRFFNSLFSMQVKDPNIRIEQELGGGTLFDIGIYCINAARYIFREEPIEAFANSVFGSDPRFREVDEMTAATLRFPHDRLATFVSSFGATDVSTYQIVGTQGDLRLDPAYEYAGKLVRYLTIQGKMTKTAYRKRDQFAPELLYFSQCVLENRDPEPNGEEGMADVRVISALYESARIGTPISLAPFPRHRRPSDDQQLFRRAPWKPALVHAESASQGD